MTAALRTETHRAVGANIKGTPAMPARKVLGDLRHLKGKADVIVTQEFKWGWYWRVLGALLLGVGKAKEIWGSSPAYRVGRKQPVSGAQAVLWKRALWKRIDTRKVLLMSGHAGISEHRYIRAVLLEDRLTGLRCWFLSTHFVVGGDGPNDGPIRQRLLDSNVARLDAFLASLERTGDPIWGEIDANIHAGTLEYRQFVVMLNKHNAKIHGAHGVEYLFTIDNREAKVVVTKNWTVQPKAHGGPLWTDHESRGTDFYLEAA